MDKQDLGLSDKRRIIVIDDNPDIHKDFATILSDRDDLSELEALASELFGSERPSSRWTGPRFELDFASQGKEGVKKLAAAVKQDTPFQLAFVDMRMPPGWNGLETIAEIWKRDPRIQIVLCTAYSDYTWEEINQTLGTSENLLILKKPFDSSEVAQMASTLTLKWRLARQAEMKQDELERQVAQRTAALQESNTRLKQEMLERIELQKQLIRSQKMEAIGTLAAGVAHDLNNILSGVLTYPDFLLMNMTESDPLYGPLNTIRKSGHKAAAIVQDMLTLARRDVATKEILNFADVVNSFLQSPEYRTLCDFHPHVTVSTRIDSDLPPVEGSAVQLEKVVMNLIANAAEAMEDAGTLSVHVTTHLLQGELPGYKSVRQGSYVKLEVTDQGVGISDADIEHIFEPFFTKKAMGRSGTGLGMTVVWDTVNNHRGYIRVRSREGIGTTLTVYLPVTEKQAAPHTAIELKEHLRGEGETILVVDDVPEQREIASAIFKTLGYRVQAVPSGEAAVESVGKQPVDILLLDMIMEPGIDGLETLKRIRTLNPVQKAVIASGYTKSKRVQQAVEMGAAYVHKPYKMDEIARVVKKLLHSNGD